MYCYWVLRDCYVIGFQGSLLLLGFKGVYSYWVSRECIVFRFDGNLPLFKRFKKKKSRITGT